MISVEECYTGRVQIRLKKEKIGYFSEGEKAKSVIENVLTVKTRKIYMGKIGKIMQHTVHSKLTKYLLFL